MPLVIWQLRIKQLAPPPGADDGIWIPTLPATPREFLRQWPSVARSVYSFQNPPVSCPLDPYAIRVARGKISMRGRGGLCACMHMYALLHGIIWVQSLQGAVTTAPHGNASPHICNINAHACMGARGFSSTLGLPPTLGGQQMLLSHAHGGPDVPFTIFPPGGNAIHGSELAAISSGAKRMSAMQNRCASGIFGEAPRVTSTPALQDAAADFSQTAPAEVAAELAAPIADALPAAAPIADAPRAEPKKAPLMSVKALAERVHAARKNVAADRADKAWASCTFRKGAVTTAPKHICRLV